MLMVISPAKTLDYDTLAHTRCYTQPDLLTHSTELIQILRKHSPAEIAELMGISDTLAVLNVGRYHDWHPPFDLYNAKQAIFAFMGDVYEGLEASTLDERQLDWLQKHLRILSGLYGCLRPLDLMQAYRLEMGTKLTNSRGKDLYTFWGELITTQLNTVLANDSTPILINLASNEYFKSVKPTKLHAQIITPVFQDLKGDQYKVISFHAKRARGLMVRWAVEQAITDPQTLKAFNGEGYTFEPAASNNETWIFRRDRHPSEFK